MTDDPVALARFRREAEVVRQISHPHIVRTLAVLETPADGYALIQEWVRGPTLEVRILDEGPMPPVEVVGIGQIFTPWAWSCTTPWRAAFRGKTGPS